MALMGKRLRGRPRSRWRDSDIAWSRLDGNGLLFHITQPISRSTIKAIACSKPTISEN